MLELTCSIISVIEALQCIFLFFGQSCEQKKVVECNKLLRRSTDLFLKCDSNPFIPDKV